MSLEMMVRVMKEAQVTRPQQSVLLAMAENADDDGKSCRPSVDRIAWKAGYKPRAVEEIMRGLREEKIIVQVAAARQHRAPEYEIQLENAPKKMPFEEWRAKHGKRAAADSRGAETAPLGDEGEDGSGAHSHVPEDDSGVHSDVSEDTSGVHSHDPGAQFDGSGVHSHDPGAHETAPEPSDEPSGTPSDEPLDAGPASKPTEPAAPDPNPSPPTGGMFVRLFDEALERIRAARPGEERKSLSGKWRKNLRRAADRELEAGRDPELLVKAASRLALRIDGYSGMELADAVNDVLAGKPWTVEQHERARRVLEDPGDRSARRESTQRHREGYEWLFGDGGEEGEGNVESEGEVSERERLVREEEGRRLEEEAEKRRREIEAERERSERIRFVGSLMAEWIRGLDEKEYSRKVFNLKRNAEANSLTEDDVDSLDEEVREAHRRSESEVGEEAS